jgi:hypothetical protein
MRNRDAIYLDVIRQSAQSIALVAELAKNAFNEHEKTALMEPLTRVIYRIAAYADAQRLGRSFSNDAKFI